MNEIARESNLRGHGSDRNDRAAMECLGECSGPADGINMQTVENWFTFHQPKQGQKERYELLRSAAKTMASVIAQMCPDSRERALAIDHLREAIMFANASIACNE